MAFSQEDQGPSHCFSMRFAKREVEQAFSASKKGILIRRVKSLAALHFFVSLCPLIHFLAFNLYDPDNAPSEAGHESFLAHATGHGSLATLMLLVLASSPAWERCCSVFLIEALTVLGTIMAMSVIVLTAPRRFTKLRGNELVDVFGDDYDSDSGFLLILDIFVTATHLGLPVRWCVLAPLELAAPFLYFLVLSLAGSAEPAADIFYNVLCLLVLIACSAMGKRAVEREERRSFCDLINEKSLRCEAEHQLSQHHFRVQAEESEGGKSSEAPTDKSGAIFEAFFQKGADRETQLRLVAEKGDSEHWRIRATELALLGGEALGEGSFGSVQKGVFCGMAVAVKRPRLQPGQVKVPQLCNELRVLRHLRHPHIVATHGAVVLPEQQQLLLVLELIEGPELRAFLLERPSVFRRYQVMHGVCRALVYMHTRTPHLVHGDLKDSNILVTLVSGCAFPKVLDFGLSRVVHAQSRALGGTLAWMAPEVLDRAPVHCSADIYSFGHVLSFCATGVPPQPPSRRWRGAPPRAPTWPRGAESMLPLQPLVQACLQQKQELRPAIARVHAELLALAARLPLQESSEEASEMKKALEEKRARCAAYLLELGMVVGSVGSSVAVEPLAQQELPEPSKPGALASLPEEDLPEKELRATFESL